MLACSFVNAQLLTGVWKGKIDHRNVELKIVKNGDSLTGTSYYYTSANNFWRYSIKGYFDATDNSVVWWDDQLIEERSGKSLLPKRPASPHISKADFNCPGGTEMYLTGRAALKEKPDQQDGTTDLQKFITPCFVLICCTTTTGESRYSHQSFRPSLEVRYSRALPQAIPARSQGAS